MAFSSWLLALSFVAAESNPQQAPGATEIEPRWSQQSIPEGKNRLLEAQVPTKAALRPPSGRLLGLLGPSWASRKGPRELPGGSRGSSGKLFCAVSIRWAPGGQKTISFFFEHM